jgi:phosphoribosylformylglycinamidine cyclo-ligase
MPGFYQKGEYDLAGFCVGVVERDQIIDNNQIAEGHVLIGLPSSGAHSNGYSLIRKVIEKAALPKDDPLMAKLLAPTRIYAKSVLAALDTCVVHGMSHITGGGLLENLPRMFPANSETNPPLAALIDRDAWQWPELFSWLQQAGNVAEEEMLRAFNCGIGFVLCTPEPEAQALLAALSDAGETPVVIGKMVTADAKPEGREVLIA